MALPLAAGDACDGACRSMTEILTRHNLCFTCKVRHMQTLQLSASTATQQTLQTLHEVSATDPSLHKIKLATSIKCVMQRCYAKSCWPFPTMFLPCITPALHPYAGDRVPKHNRLADCGAALQLPQHDAIGHRRRRHPQLRRECQPDHDVRRVQPLAED